jgi:type I restriction enzyme, R subunit
MPRCWTSILEVPTLEKRGKTLEINLVARLRKHGQPEVHRPGRTTGEDQGASRARLPDSLEFLKEIGTGPDVLEAEKQVDPVEERDKAKEALTELFQEAKNQNTHIIVERIVADIDEIVKNGPIPRLAAHDGRANARCKKLRRALLKYKLHKDQDLFDRAYGYIRQYY